MTTNIEWTDETWNPVVGCDRISPGCDHCYAIGVAHRAMQAAHVGLTVKRAGERPDWSGVIRCLPERLDTPSRWRKPRRIFVNSMSDLFHPDVPDDFIAEVYASMVAASDAHTFQVLTKRPQRMAKLLASDGFRLDVQTKVWERETHMFAGFVRPNIWWGVSIESDRYSFRADHLRATPAAVRFLSLEPLLGHLPSLDLTGIDWVIVGGESGPGARPMDPFWVRDLRDRCQHAGVAFFFKQWGAYAPLIGHTTGVNDLVTIGETGAWEPWSGHQHGATTRWGEEARSGFGEPIMRRLPKSAAGRLLDGRTWDQMPGQLEVPA